MIFVDTSYLVGLAVPRDSLHERAVAWSKRLAGRFLTTEFVFLEFLNLLSRPVHRPTAHRIVNYAHEHPHTKIIPVSKALYDQGLALHRQRSDQCWSLTDCISFVVMKRNKIDEALTYDRHFEQAGYRALLRHPFPPP